MNEGALARTHENQADITTNASQKEFPSWNPDNLVWDLMGNQMQPKLHPKCNHWINVQFGYDK